MPLDTNGRSPFRARQLHDLRLQPTADDPRPAFFWSAEGDRNAPPEPWHEFPKLMWHKDNPKDEITVTSQEEQDLKVRDYTTESPYLTSKAIDPLDDIQMQLDALTPDEREYVISEQKSTRMKELQARMSKLSPDTLDMLLNQAEGKPKRGRPRKTA